MLHAERFWEIAQKRLAASSSSPEWVPWALIFRHWGAMSKVPASCQRCSCHQTTMGPSKGRPVGTHTAWLGLACALSPTGTKKTTVFSISIPKAFPSLFSLTISCLDRDISTVLTPTDPKTLQSTSNATWHSSLPFLCVLVLRMPQTKVKAGNKRENR